MPNGPAPEKMQAVKTYLEKEFSGCPVHANDSPPNVSPEFSFPWNGISRKVIIKRSFIDDKSIEVLIESLQVVVQVIRKNNKAEVMLG